MSDLCRDMHGVRVLHCAAAGPQIKTDRDAVDLIAIARQGKAVLVAIPAERLPDDFFHLKTRVAGEILQKFVTYGVRVAVIGDISKYCNESASLRDFVYECNRGLDIWFVTETGDLDQRLEKHADRF